jgi:hypothetical protein
MGPIQRGLCLNNSVKKNILESGSFGYDEVNKMVRKDIGDNFTEGEIFNAYRNFARKRIYYMKDKTIVYTIFNVVNDSGGYNLYEEKTCKFLFE